MSPEATETMAAAASSRLVRLRGSANSGVFTARLRRRRGDRIGRRPMLRTVKLPPLSPPDPPLDDGTVALRLITVTDIPDLVTACQDPAIARGTTLPSPYSEAEAEAWLAGQEAGMASGHALPLAIVSSTGGEL